MRAGSARSGLAVDDGEGDSLKKEGAPELEHRPVEQLP